MHRRPDLESRWPEIDHPPITLKTASHQPPMRGLRRWCSPAGTGGSNSSRCLEASERHLAKAGTPLLGSVLLDRDYVIPEKLYACSSYS